MPHQVAKVIAPGFAAAGGMTTLIELQEYQENRQTPLWRKLWLNVMPQDSAEMPLPGLYDETVFPWLRYPYQRTGKCRHNARAGESVQAYWGMPRRIRIDFNTTHSGRCDLVTESDELLAG
jgi:CRISPR system Cascade subunit CasA